MVATPEPSWHPGWLLDEVARAGRENLDEGHVARYDAKEEADAPDEVRVCQELGLTPGVDRGGPRCRNGSVALAVAPHYARVVAVTCPRSCSTGYGGMFSTPV